MVFHLKKAFVENDMKTNMVSRVRLSKTLKNKIRLGEEGK